MDVSLAVTVELGRTRMPLRQVLELQNGSVIELDRLAGDAVDIFVNDRLIARGEVVVVDDKFGVRITELLTNPAVKRNTHVACLAAISQELVRAQHAQTENDPRPGWHQRGGLRHSGLQFTGASRTGYGI
jgi:flagellar motor switch protein FliN